VVGRVVHEAAQALRAVLGRDAERAVFAPGRVNLIGEHTDYNGGLVLPCAIDRGTAAAAARRSDGRLRVHSTTLGETVELDPGSDLPEAGFAAYVAGVAAALSSEGLPVPGLDVALASDLPRESGLSSSAALEVALVTLVDSMAGQRLSGEERARLAWRAESEFVGVPCGRMDQLASALGRRDHALRIDCSDFATTLVPLPGERLRLLIADSGVRRRLAAGGYARRRAECEEGLAQARAAGLAPRSATSWRDVDPARLPELGARLDPVSARRARHVLTENARVDAVCAALRAGDLPATGALLRAGQQSLRDDFEVSCPELDALCEIADGSAGCFGSRLTGAGFGGCTLHLVAPERAAAVAAALRTGFAARFDREPPLLEVRPSDGARLVADGDANGDDADGDGPGRCT
jgi:galactokinase